MRYINNDCFEYEDIRSASGKISERDMMIVSSNALQVENLLSGGR